ncbi:hypothetical protein V5799_030598 [Amblyomma americanum]|uniref:D-aminoacyl-tRNA deacylase n=1 Tax=Amblyomma americanum TaxID=6943 RepID=A0AAQ4EMT9_AMBAM
MLVCLKLHRAPLRAEIETRLCLTPPCCDARRHPAGRGLCVLVGIHRDDTEDDIDYIVRKVLNLKLFDDDGGKRWKQSTRDLQFEVLCVSQFTLYGTLKGNKPDFHLAMEGDRSKQFYERFLHKIRAEYREDLVKDGEFGALMKVDIQNDGPVTLEIESSAFRKAVPLPQERGEPDGGAADGAVP